MTDVGTVSQGTLKALHKLNKCLVGVFFNESGFFSFLVLMLMLMLITVLNNQPLLPLRPPLL